MSHKKWSLLLPVLLFCLSAEAQRADDPYYFFGLKGGAAYSTISGIKAMIIPDIFPTETYTATEEYRIGVVAGVFISHRFPNSILAIQPEVTFSMQGANLKYSDINDLEYSLEFRYQYINVLPLLKVHPLGGLYIGLGPQLGFNILTDNIVYTSNQPDLGPDLQIQEALRGVLKGRTDFSAVFALGYDIAVGGSRRSGPSFLLNIDARYILGISDVIETQANGFNFIENQNRSTAILLTLGAAIPIN